MTAKEVRRLTGGLGTPSKMPGSSYGISPSHCKTGSKLAQIPGTVCHGCYATKGNYTFPSVRQGHAARETAMSGFSAQWIDAMVFAIATTATRNGVPYHRWHDSGDLQSVEHLAAIAEIARRTPKVKHWLPTKEYAMVKDFLRTHKRPPNLVIRVSGYRINGGAPRWPLRAGLTVSSVASATPAPGAYACPSRQQGGRCGECRACWSNAIKHVSYHLH